MMGTALALIGLFCFVCWGFWLLINIGKGKNVIDHRGTGGGWASYNEKVFIEGTRIFAILSALGVIILFIPYLIFPAVISLFVWALWGIFFDKKEGKS